MTNQALQNLKGEIEEANEKIDPRSFDPKYIYACISGTIESGEVI